ncbi:DUF4349 domain-containing protein [Streptomyces sp. 4N509B]|uniref:DUF4349 domain-containing protein n=1 Tax=Streptomyces sp. 4N509B TaxID=3457413 RepID=UPI003FD0FA7C
MSKPPRSTTTHRRRVVLPVLAPLALTLTLSLTGCGGGTSEDLGATDAEMGASQELMPQDGGGGAAGDAAAEAAGEADLAGTDEAGARDGAAGAADTPALTPEHLIVTARLTVVTDDVPDAFAEAVSLTEAAGGHVSGESTDRASRRHESSSLTLRVPQERYEELMADLAGLGELSQREVETEDVTDQVVDVESRIETQRESVDRVRALMDEAVTIDDIVTIEGELSTRQAELEALLSQQATLRGQTAMATVHLELHTPGNEPREKKDDSSAPSVGDALAGGWNAFVATLAWSAAILLAVLPFAVALFLVGLVAWRLQRRAARSRAAAGASAASDAGEAGDAGSTGDA